MIKKLSDGLYAQCKEVRVNNNISVIVPVNDKRYATELDAISGLEIRSVEVKSKVEIEIPHLPSRDRFRVIKLAKGNWVVELRNEKGKWEEVRTCTTSTRAQNYITSHSK